MDLSGIEHGHEAAQMIMRRGAILVRTKPARERMLLAAEQRDAGKFGGSGQHRQTPKE